MRLAYFLAHCPDRNDEAFISFIKQLEGHQEDQE